MSKNVAQMDFLDATVLGNFASSNAVAQLVTILDRPVAIPAVREGLERGRKQNYGFLSDTVDRRGEEILE